MQGRLSVFSLFAFGTAFLITVGTFSRAQDANPIDESWKRQLLADEQKFGEVLFPDAQPSRNAACFVRHYDAAHLNAHPYQKVTSISILVTSEPWQASDDPTTRVSTKWKWSYAVQARQRDGKLRHNVSDANCRFDHPDPQDGHADYTLECNIECDAGDTLRVRPDGKSALFGLAHGDLANPNYDPQEDGQGGKPREHADDHLFRLARAPVEECEKAPAK